MLSYISKSSSFHYGFRYFYFISVNTWSKFLKGSTIICPAPVVHSSARDRYGASRRSFGLLRSLCLTLSVSEEPSKLVLVSLHSIVTCEPEDTADFLIQTFCRASYQNISSSCGGWEDVPNPHALSWGHECPTASVWGSLWVGIRCCCPDTKIAPEWDRAGHQFSAHLLLESREFWVHQQADGNGSSRHSNITQFSFQVLLQKPCSDLSLSLTMFHQLGHPALELLMTNQEPPDLEDHAINIQVAQLRSNSVSRYLCLGSRRVLHLRRSWVLHRGATGRLGRDGECLFRAKSHHYRKGGQEDPWGDFPRRLMVERILQNGNWTATSVSPLKEYPIPAWKTVCFESSTELSSSGGSQYESQKTRVGPECPGYTSVASTLRNVSIKNYIYIHIYEFSQVQLVYKASATPVKTKLWAIHRGKGVLSSGMFQHILFD